MTTRLPAAISHVLAIPPYPPGRPISAVAREFGLDPKEIVKLASNENPLGPCPGARKAIVAGAASSSLYPDFDTFALRECLAKHLAVTTDRVLPGAGSSNHIDLIARAFLEPGRSALIPQYSFTAYERAVISVGAKPLTILTQDFAIDVDRILEAIDPSVSVLYLASPNNPTGTRLDNEALYKLIAEVPERIVIVLDEAYRDYLDPADRPATDRLPESRPNVVVLRTFSKIHGLAGMRVAYAIADPEMVRILRLLELPFAVSALAEAAAVAALDDAEFQVKSRLMNTSERTRVQAALAQAEVQYLPSHGNFVLIRAGNGLGIFKALLRRGIIVRPMDNYQLPEWIRVSIGLPKENDLFLRHFLEIVK